jgi:hypothetical protein
MRERYSENGYAGLFESSAHGASANIPKQHDADAGIIEAFRQVVGRGDLLAVAGGHKAAESTGLFWKRVPEFSRERVDDGDRVVRAADEERFAVWREIDSERLQQ